MTDAPLLFRILGLVSLLAVLLTLRKFLNIASSLIACVWRAKENVNLESSVSLARDRNVVCGILMVPLCIAIAYYNLWCIEVFDGLSPELRLLVTAGILLVLSGVRALLARLLEPKGVNQKTYAAIKNCWRNFAILVGLVGLLVIGVLDFAGAETELIRLVTLCVAGFGYLVYLVRKLQIFAGVGTVFSTILYLCILELLPTGILVGLAILF